MRRRVVITGMGVITALGSDLDRFWNSLVAGESGVRRITQFDASDLPCQIAGEVIDYDPQDYMPLKEARRLSRASQLALAASHKAVEDAGLARPIADPGRVGVYFGTGIGGIERAIEGVKIIETKGYNRLNPFTLPSAIPNMPAFHITRDLEIEGPSSTITTACATGPPTSPRVVRCRAFLRARRPTAGPAP